MTDAVIIALIGGIVSIVSLAMTLLIKKSQSSLESNQKDLHKQINSRMDELLRLTKEKGKAEGKAEEKAEQNR